MLLYRKGTNSQQLNDSKASQKSMRNVPFTVQQKITFLKKLYRTLSFRTNEQESCKCWMSSACLNDYEVVTLWNKSVHRSDNHMILCRYTVGDNILGFFGAFSDRIANVEPRSQSVKTLNIPTFLLIEFTKANMTPIVGVIQLVYASPKS